MPLAGRAQKAAAWPPLPLSHGLTKGPSGWLPAPAREQNRPAVEGRLEGAEPQVWPSCGLESRLATRQIPI